MRSLSRKVLAERVVAVTVVVLAWAAVLPRAVTGSAGDHGTFVSVAERLLAGDKLYTGVWDNKDPLFYYLLAGARALTDRGDTALEVAWLVAGCIAVALIGRLAGVTGDALLVVAWALTPLVLTGHAYEPGLTHLPGVVTTLWITACVLSQRPVAAGALLVVLALLKLVLLPLGLAVLLVGALDGEAPRRTVIRAGIGATGAAAVAASLLALLGELNPYLEALWANVGYADSAMGVSRWGPTVAHLRIIFTGGGLTTLGAIGVVWLLTSARGGSGAGRPLPKLAAATTLAAVGVLALTGLWPHHVQVLEVPAVLALVTLAAEPDLSHPARLPRRVALLGVVAFLLAGAPSPSAYLEAIDTARDRAATVVGISPEARALAERPAGAYARLGSNDLDAHARGLADRTLACPRFHAYVTDNPRTYAETLFCLHRARYVIVDASFTPMPGESAWNDFILRGRAQLAEDFDCESTSFGQLCSRR